MDVYTFSFTVLSTANCLLGYLSTKSNPSDIDDPENEPLAEKLTINPTKDAKEFQRVFFIVYIFVVAADALQSPYMYTLYRDEKQFSEAMVAALFATGFVSAAISASFVGDLADRYGRKYACQWFCALYSMSCILVVSPRLELLVLGRVFGGIGMTLIASVFETWMVSEYHAREMREKGLDITLVFGRMTTTNCIVAIIAGITGEILVDQTGTKLAPFMAALVCLGVAAVLISGLWPENYGTKMKLREDGVGGGTDLKTIIKDKRIVSLSLISCLFEGSLYLFGFFWPAAIKSVRAASPDSTSPPFGLIFATFMSAAMLGSLAFTQSGQAISPPTIAQTLKLVITITAASLLVIVRAKPESLTLWAFCALQACVGIYNPSMGYLKEQLVPDGIRGKTYGLLRLPLNIFVVFALSMTQEGDQYRNNIFMACTGLLVVACGICHHYVRF